MSARITIQSGIAAGSYHDVYQRVARVGSDPGSDICLPSANIPGHALTLEFREEGCRVYNRCRNNVYVGAQVLEPDQVAPWPETDILELADDIELLLDLAPETIVPAIDHDDEIVESQASTAAVGQPRATKASGSGRTLMQLGVTVACLVGCVLLLVRDQSRKEPRKSEISFGQVIADSLESDTPRSLIQRLQYAEAQRVRLRHEAATSEFEQIRDDLLSAGQPIGVTESAILALIQERLADYP